MSRPPSFRKLLEHKQNKVSPAGAAVGPGAPCAGSDSPFLPQSLSEIVLISCENDLHLCREYFARGLGTCCSRGCWVGWGPPSAHCAVCGFQMFTTRSSCSRGCSRRRWTTSHILCEAPAEPRAAQWGSVCAVGRGPSQGDGDGDERPGTWQSASCFQCVHQGQSPSPLSHVGEACSVLPSLSEGRIA